MQNTTSAGNNDFILSQPAFAPWAGEMPPGPGLCGENCGKRAPGDCVKCPRGVCSSSSGKLSSRPENSHVRRKRDQPCERPLLSSPWDAEKLGPDSFRKRENAGKRVWRRGSVPGAGHPVGPAGHGASRGGKEAREAPMMQAGRAAGILPKSWGRRAGRAHTPAWQQQGAPAATRGG